MDPPFAITTPSTTVELDENRFGTVAFTVANTTDRTIRTRFVATALGGAPPGWFSVEGEHPQDLAPRGARQVRVKVEPPLGAPAGKYSFRLDAIGVEQPESDHAEGPASVVAVPPSTAEGPTPPRGYLATLVGASAGASVGELIAVIAALTGGDEEPDCAGIGCALGEAIGQVILLVIVLLIAYVLMLIGASIGAWLGLRHKRYLGSKLTAVFLAILMVPWSILMLATVFQLLHDLVVVAIAAPVLLVSVPAVIARALVLLIRTRRI